MLIRKSSRRSFVKLVAAAPLLSQIAARDLYAQAASAVGRDPRQNVYTRLGVKTVINCRGTWTYLSGSLEFPEVRQAQLEAAQHFVNMLDLQRAVGRRLSELTGAESGIITSGAAGAMAAATAGCMAGTDDKSIWQLPDTTGLKHEVIMVGGRSALDVKGQRQCENQQPETEGVELGFFITITHTSRYPGGLIRKVAEGPTICEGKNGTEASSTHPFNRSHHFSPFRPPTLQASSASNHKQPS